jgi:hypothetical protein
VRHADARRRRRRLVLNFEIEILTHVLTEETAKNACCARASKAQRSSDYS